MRTAATSVKLVVGVECSTVLLATPPELRNGEGTLLTDATVTFASTKADRTLLVQKANIGATTLVPARTAQLLAMIATELEILTAQAVETTKFWLTNITMKQGIMAGLA